ncbi:hypothetical protein L873DRAFT_1806062 [Choiromyces venosus 120613-1]|uniref:Uncharacterized protein n=1 Tax=Choiromyces venosus 120613-1 TaxID=1336337 RepID=A0A3N4JNP7_9PEZI|nr:hypothetical protein L873DRAFT_1806062 [Choiromyces venosus 120613-1]
MTTSLSDQNKTQLLAKTLQTIFLPHSTDMAKKSEKGKSHARKNKRNTKHPTCLQSLSALADVNIFKDKV